MTTLGVQRRGRWLREFWASTIGKKIVVATTGVILAIYLILHALGNLHAFQGAGDGGAAEIDSYANWLRTMGAPAIPHEGALWVIRVVMLLALVLHVVAIAQLTRRNFEARPEGHRPQRQVRTFESMTMLVTGLFILAFLVFHVLQFTTRTVQVTPVIEGTVYANLYDAFQKWYFVLLYVAAALVLALHMRHALWSVTQTMGWDKPNRNPTFRRTATVTAVLVGAAFAAVPIAFWIGALPEPG